jgi:asparagine synthase (glutamine-hydrolysing)
MPGQPPNHTPTLTSGIAKFSDSHLAKLAASQGAMAAWRAAVAKGAPSAAVGVTGDFAVGFTDEQGRGFLAVDRFSIQTVCYRVVDGQLRFAARADELADANTDIDPQAIFDYLYFHVIPSPRTIFKGIFRLPAGHYAWFENGKLSVAPYWVPRFDEALNPSFPELQAEFKDLLGQAVASQLDGSQPACFLSGGTDSSTIVGMAAKATAANGQKVATYSIGFDAQGYDEMEFARIAAKHFKTEHHEYYVTPQDLVHSIPTVAAHFDQPFGNSSALPAYYCAKVARGDGVTRLLAGDGGDELFGGNSRYAKQRVFGWYGHIPGFLQKGLLEPLLTARAAAAVPITRKAGSYVEQARVPMPDRLQMYNLIMRLGPNEVLTPQLMAQVDVGRPLDLQRSVWQATAGASHLNQELAFDWRFTLAECDLPKVMGATRLAQIGVGFPMLDDHLLAFSQKLPSSYKLKGSQLRWFFKEALRGFLPDDIITKKKQGFGLPFGVWANSTPALNALASESLHSLASRGVVRQDFVQTLLTQRLPEHPGYFGEMVWILTMLEQWLRQHKPAFKL